MGNLIESFASSVVNAVGGVLEGPLDFLSGKSCRPACGSTWDLICYIEHFCVANLLKLAAILLLFYAVLVVIYLLFKTGVFGCLGGAIGKMLRACCSSTASACQRGFWSLRRALRRKRKERAMVREEELELEELEDEEYRVGFYSGARERRWPPPSPSSSTSWSARSRERRRLHLERSLRARSHRIRVELTERPRHGRRSERTLHGVRVTRASRFVRKPSASRLYRRRW